MIKRSMFLILLFCCPLHAELLKPSTVLTSNEGVVALSTNLPFIAQEKFVRALEENPYSPELHLNLAFSFFKQGQMEKARSEYETALKLSARSKDPAKIEFIANHNLGTVAQLEKKTDLALEFYQKALTFNPDSQETKINIELLTQESEKKGGEGDKKDKDDKGEKKDQQDKEGQDPKKDGDKDDKDSKDDKSDKEKENKNYKKNKPQAPKFKSEQLTEGDVKKILGELRQQEQKIRAEFNKKDAKEKPNEKDW